MSHKINKPDTTTYYVAFDPLNGIYHEGYIESQNCLGTGLPFVVFGEDRDATYDLIFSEYAFEDDLDQMKSFKARELSYGTGYSKAVAELAIAEAKSVLPNLMIRAIKHPDKDEYALPWLDYVISKAPKGKKKEKLKGRHNVSLASGKVKNKDEMLTGDWIDIVPF